MIIDNNVLFSLMEPGSVASDIFELAQLEFSAPSFVKSELSEHEMECLKKSGLTKEAFEQRKTLIFSKIRFAEVSEYKKFLKKAFKALPDKDDVPYLAFALSSGQPIWSNDLRMKEQSLSDVFTTEELIKLLPL